MTSSTANISATSLKNNVSEGSLSLAAEEFDEEVGDAGPGVVSPREIAGAGALNVVDGGDAGFAAGFPLTVHGLVKILAADDSIRIFIFFFRLKLEACKITDLNCISIKLCYTIVNRN